MRETVIALRSNKGQPHGDHFAKAQFALLVAMGRKKLIEEGRNLRFLHFSQQHRDVVDSFDFNQADHLVNHSSRLPDVFSSQKSLLVEANYEANSRVHGFRCG